MTLYNTAMPVVANIEAASPEEATAALRRALEAAGFEVYDADDQESLRTFAAEDGTEPSGLPAPHHPAPVFALPPGALPPVHY